MSDATEITEASVLSVGPRRRGRPRLPEPRSTVSTWVWARHHDRLIQVAEAQGVTLSKLVQVILEKAVPPR